VSVLRDRSFPALDPSVIAYEDDDVIVVDKPPFVATQAQRVGAEDDLPARLATFLRARDGAEPYVGTHQRLDQATSGLIVYAKRPEANAWLARAFEDRRVEKTYVAVTTGAPLPSHAAWEDALIDAGGDRVRVVPRGTRGARLARTEIAVLDRRGDRTLVRARIETGRTHQIRAQLAHRGAPIAGDGWYGGARCARLCLASVALRIPREHGPSVEAAIETPRALLDFLGGRLTDARDDERSAASALRFAAERRYELAHDPGTSCFRWVNDEADGAAAIAIDVYGEHAVLHAYDDGDVDVIARALVDAGVRGVYLKRRPKSASRLDEAATLALAPRDPIAGLAADAEIEVLERGIPFLVRLGDGLSTGLFLDQRANRARVREDAKGARVLNLFAYTCAFSIAAAAGGAVEIVSVDAAKKQLERGARGFAHGGFDAGKHEAIADDAFAVLDRLARRERVFDLVVVDPPTYSSTKRTRFTSARMWPELAAKVLRVVAPGGTVLATSNDRRLAQVELRASFRDAARALGIALGQLKDLPPPIDFPVCVGDAPHLKGVLVRR
jgi:23S rRNA (cytosine1962-C5)-methyltransferase